MNNIQSVLSAVCVKMAKLYFVSALLMLQIGSSAETPPKVADCRIVFKAKQTVDNSNAENFTFLQGHSCVSRITLPLPGDTVVNITDPRNCENFYKCTGLSCSQCPCPEGQFFNPVTLQCSAEYSACLCPAASTTGLVSSTPQTIPSSSTERIQSTNSSATGKSVTPTSQGQTQEISNGVIIIAAIVTATVIILLLLIVGFVLWQRGLFVLRKKPPMLPSNNDGYLHTLSTPERHVYAEIDEQMIRDEANSQKVYPYAQSPPIPVNPPPACVHHPHQTFTLPPRSYQPVHTQSYPMHSTPRGHRDNLININSSPYPANQSQDGGDSSSQTSCSGCSNCSGTSNHTQIDNNENIDRRKLLTLNNDFPPQLTQWNYVSKQVYI